ncbi:Uncharacterised protein [Mycobacteroides abscessus subsp. abscessus]|nr:Uncharacterised protein [Mycobacteroides abscessus subsp. abscessus]
MVVPILSPKRTGRAASRLIRFSENKPCRIPIVALELWTMTVNNVPTTTPRIGLELHEAGTDKTDGDDCCSRAALDKDRDNDPRENTHDRIGSKLVQYIPKFITGRLLEAVAHEFNTV